MSTVDQLISASELERMGDAADHCELIDGELVPMSPAGAELGAVAMQLGIEIGVFVREQQLGETFAAETGFVISRDPDTVLAPDVAVVLTESRGDRKLTRSFFDGAPDLAVEVLSPSERVNEVATKVARWLKAGCQEVWIVDAADSSIAIHRSTTDVTCFSRQEALSGSLVLPGFEVKLSELFAACRQ